MIRRADLSEVEQMLDWAAAEGWNPGRDDAAAFHAADPEGFFVAEVEGRPVACISVVNHSPHFAFLGFYICVPEMRGRGLGLDLWRMAIAHAGDRTVGLDGVPAQEMNYVRSGFGRTGATLRMAGPALPEGGGVRAAEAGDFTGMARLDAAANGVTRPAFLRAWLADTATRRTVVLPGADGIAGLATARLCREGCKVGPVIAPGEDAALALAGAAAAALEADKVIIDVPDSQQGMLARLRGLGFEETFGTARMYRGTPPAGDGTLFAIATMELG
ncbi:GNAT family N-acetyltransferase [Pseudooceanicola sp. LIPI14-2-Ac024]|uniref:GNAT family N-acetyltransferase n=1 Tax=Pseudooceanicola sp. LIPI14-2-Ac024 TaxID=3344875 RepID=UPI0035D12D71